MKYEDVRDVAVVTLLTPDLSEDFDIGSVRIELEALLEQTRAPPDDPVPGSREVDVTGLRGDAAGASSTSASAKGIIRLCRVSPPLQEFLEKTQLPLLVDIFPTLEEAMDTPWE